MKFHLTADFVFHAENLDDALEKLAEFLLASRASDKIVLDGQIKIEPEE